MRVKKSCCLGERSPEQLNLRRVAAVNNLHDLEAEILPPPIEF